MIKWDSIQSMEFSRPEYWSGCPFPSPGDLPNPGIKPRSPALWADSLTTEPQGQPRKATIFQHTQINKCGTPYHQMEE